MAKGYFIFTELIKNQDRYQDYARKAVATITESGGRPLVVSDEPEVIEGQWHGPRTVILEFDSVEAAN